MEGLYNNGVLFLTPELVKFEKSGDFVKMVFKIDVDKLCTGTLDVKRKREYERVRLRRSFPFALTDEYISVLDEEQNEIGLIKELSVFPNEDIEIVRSELERVYYCPEILKINSVKERLGFAYFDVVCSTGRREIPLKDVHRSMIRVGDDKIIIIDADGNRYTINSVGKLDAKSMKKLEMYI